MIEQMPFLKNTPPIIHQPNHQSILTQNYPPNPNFRLHNNTSLKVCQEIEPNEKRIKVQKGPYLTDTVKLKDITSTYIPNWLES